MNDTAEIIFLNKELVLRIQSRLIESTGGAYGLRDEGGLESALNAAVNRYDYENADVIICAATYAYHLTKAHSFVDGNKRVAAAVTETFLKLNNAKLPITNDQLADLFLSIAAGEMTREEVEQFFSSHVKLKAS